MAGPEDPVSIEFRRFKVVPYRRELLADGRPVELGGRAFDTLIALLDARGTVLSKDELMSRVWPDRVVEENNLAAQIAALRQVFGADRDLIRTVAGRGYQFTGEIRVTAAPAAGPAPSRATNLPEALSELIGREAELGEVTALATEHRQDATGPGDRKAPSAQISRWRIRRRARPLVESRACPGHRGERARPHARYWHRITRRCRGGGRHQ